MKLKALLTALLIAGVATSLAVASPPPGKGTDRGRDATATTTNPSERAAKRNAAADARQRPVVMLVLKGELVSASASSFAMLVKHSNKHARSLRGKQVTVKVDNKTKFRRHGKAELSDLAVGDRLHVLVRARKNADRSTSELLARHVHARPARAEHEDTETGTTTGTTTSGTNTGTTTAAD